MQENGFGCALIANQIFRPITELCNENAKVGVSPFKRLLLNKSMFAHNYEKAILLIPSNFQLSSVPIPDRNHHIKLNEFA